MADPVLRRAAALSAAGERFVLATVVWRRGPSSGREGGRAIITADGAVTGWIGGACAEPTVVREARLALGDGRPRLMYLGPFDESEGRSRPGVVSVPMACESEGAMEVFLEPHLPVPHVVVVGRSPAVAALVRLTAALRWSCAVVDDGGDAAAHPEAVRVVTSLDLKAAGVDESTFVVVATQGHYDEEAVQAALETPAAYVGLVASRKRADRLLEFLRDRGVAEGALARVRAPAGMDLGSVEHEEVAVAVLAELVALRASGRALVEVAAPEEAVDPVCGMTVAVATAHHTIAHEGTTYYFCAAGCLKAFEGSPLTYLGGA